MGHYAGVATRIVVGNPDSLAGQFFDAVYDDNANAVEAFDLLGLGVVLQRNKTDFITSIYNNSAYFDAWAWQVVEETKQGRRYSSRASIRFAKREIWLTVLNHLKDGLVVSEGDIVYREIYESSEMEHVIAFVGGEFVVREGFCWEGGEEHDDHPSNKEAVEGQPWEEYLAWEETWFPGWNLDKLER